MNLYQPNASTMQHGRYDTAAAGRWIVAALACLWWLLSVTSSAALPDGVRAEAYVTGLRFPVAMTTTPDGDVLVTEKGIDVEGGPTIPGAIRYIDDGTLAEEPLATFDVKTVNESGMLGIDLMPDFTETGEFLVVYTPKDDQQHLYVTKLRLKDDGTGEVLADPLFKLPSRPGATRHFGGNIRMTDQYIYVSLSDLTQDHHPQDLSSPNGSILRLNHDGSVPADNPFGSDNPIYAYGLRNCFDMDFDSQGQMYCGENGHTRHDHINKIQKGHNYGWPTMVGYCDHHPILERCEGKDFTEPVHEFSYRVGPTGMLVYDGSMFPEWQGHLFLGGWHTGEVHHLRPDQGNDAGLYEVPAAWFVLPDGPFGLQNDAERQHLDQYGVTDVAQASDGAILVLESGVNRGTLYRVAPTAEIIDPDKIVESGQRRLKNRVQAGRACATVDGQPGGGWWAIVLLMVGWWVRRLSRRDATRTSQRRGRLHAGLWAAVVLACLAGAPSAAVGADIEVEYGGMLGLDGSTPSGDNIYNGHLGIGTAAVGVVRAEWLEYVGAQAELGYSLKGSGLKRTTERLNLTYATLPVSVYGQLPGQTIDWRLHAGVATNVLIRAAMSDGPPFTEKVKPFEFGLFGGFGVDIHTDMPVDVTVDARYERGLTTLLDPDEKPAYIGTMDAAWTNTVYLFVGGLF